MEVRRRYPGEQTRVTSESRRSQLPEPSRVNAVLLQLEVERLVVGSEKPRRLALVATGDLKDPADRLLLGVRCGGLGDLPQRGVDGRRLSGSAVAGDGSTEGTERCSGSITSEARMMAPRMTFRSSRTFPGQWWRRRT